MASAARLLAYGHRGSPAPADVVTGQTSGRRDNGADKVKHNIP